MNPQVLDGPEHTMHIPSVEGSFNGGFTPEVPAPTAERVEIDPNVHDWATGDLWTQGLVDFYRSNGIEPTEIATNVEQLRAAQSLIASQDTNYVMALRNQETGDLSSFEVTNLTAVPQQESSTASFFEGILDRIIQFAAPGNK